MPDFVFSAHARDMLIERSIPEEWIWRPLNSHDRKRTGEDGNLHFSKAIKEKEGCVLHVIVNPNVIPNRIVTLFFDRRLGRSHENKN